MSSPESCKHPGCPHPRLHLSAFCQEHHDQQLIRAALQPSKPRPDDPTGDFIRTCERVQHNFDRQAIERSEYVDQVYDLFIHYAGISSPDCWETALNKLDPSLWPEVLLFAEQSPNRGIFRGGAMSEEKRKAALQRAEELRHELIGRLRRHLESH